jgi:hypothetical protein
MYVQGGGVARCLDFVRMKQTRLEWRGQDVLRELM